MLKRVQRSGTKQDWEEKGVIFPQEVSYELGPNGESELPERGKGREHWVGMEESLLESAEQLKEERAPDAW